MKTKLFIILITLFALSGDGYSNSSHDFYQDTLDMNEVQLTHAKTISNINLETDHFTEPRMVMSELSHPVLYLFIAVELMASLILFLKLGFEYLKSNQPYHSKGEKPLIKFS